MKPANARELSPVADLSLQALINAVKLLPGTKLYEVRVSEVSFQEAKDLAAEHIISRRQSNPFTPWINITFVAEYDRDEWSLHVEGECVWSPGC